MRHHAYLRIIWNSHGELLRHQRGHKTDARVRSLLEDNPHEDHPQLGEDNMLADDASAGTRLWNIDVRFLSYLAAFVLSVTPSIVRRTLQLAEVRTRPPPIIRVPSMSTTQR